jgi:hypothetical protein
MVLENVKISKNSSRSCPERESERKNIDHEEGRRG